MALAFVGGTSGASTAASTYVVSLTGLSGGLASAPAAGDIVIVVTGIPSSQDENPGISSPSGYTELCDLYSDDVRDANLSVNWKIMGGTPDTSVTLLATATGQGAGAAIHVWRNVDQTTPIDVTTTTATGIDNSHPNSPSITPVTTGAVILSCGLGTNPGGSLPTAFTAPTGFTNSISLPSQGTANSAIICVASSSWSGGAVDPAAWTGGASNSFDSWCAATVVLRPGTGTPPASARPVVFVCA